MGKICDRYSQISFKLHRHLESRINASLRDSHLPRKSVRSPNKAMDIGKKSAANIPHNIASKGSILNKDFSEDEARSETLAKIKTPSNFKKSSSKVRFSDEVNQP